MSQARNSDDDREVVTARRPARCDSGDRARAACASRKLGAQQRQEVMASSAGSHARGRGCTGVTVATRLARQCSLDGQQRFQAEQGR